jgi:hypothetical protein
MWHENFCFKYLVLSSLFFISFFCFWALKHEFCYIAEFLYPVFLASCAFFPAFIPWTAKSVICRCKNILAVILTFAVLFLQCVGHKKAMGSSDGIVRAKLMNIMSDYFRYSQKSFVLMICIWKCHLSQKSRTGISWF